MRVLNALHAYNTHACFMRHTPWIEGKDEKIVDAVELPHVYVQTNATNEQCNDNQTTVHTEH